jgi:hypothetical protein
VKLYRIKLLGFQTTNIGVSYVVAENPSEAWEKILNFLNEKDYGFKNEREFDTIELLADTYEYCKTPSMLFL